MFFRYCLNDSLKTKVVQVFSKRFLNVRRSCFLHFIEAIGRHRKHYRNGTKWLLPLTIYAGASLGAACSVLLIIAECSLQSMHLRPIVDQCLHQNLDGGSSSSFIASSVLTIPSLLRTSASRSGGARPHPCYA